MVSMFPVEIAPGTVCTGIEIELPQTHLAIVCGRRGYIMCGALDVALLDERLGDRRIVAARAQGVRNVPQLLAAPLSDVTAEAQRLGVREGMLGAEAMKLMV